MDIGALSDQELLNYIIFLGAGALVFAGIFVVTMVFYIRGRQATTKRKPASDAMRVVPTSAGEESDTMSLLKSRMKKTQKADADAQTAAAPSPTQPSTAGVAYRELLRVLVDPSGKKIVVEVEGKRYETISQIKDRSIGRRILETVAALLKFSGGYMTTAEGTKAMPIPNVKLTALPAKAASVSVPPAPSAAPAAQARPTAAQPPEMSPAVAEFLADMEAASQSMKQSETPKTSQPFWGRAFKGGDKKVSAAPETPAFSLAEEIDKIVQQKLKAANDWTRVKIQSGAGGMVRFQVAGKVYESVDQIEEVNVQAVIKSAIEEWNG